MDFKPDRLGHFLHVTPSQLSRALSDETPVEICPASNCCTLNLPHLGHHPTLKKLVDANHPVSFSTDDPGVFDTTASHSLALAADCLGWDEWRVGESVCVCICSMSSCGVSAWSWGESRSKPRAYERNAGTTLAPFIEAVMLTGVCFRVLLQHFKKRSPHLTSTLATPSLSPLPSRRRLGRGRPGVRGQPPR